MGVEIAVGIVAGCLVYALHVGCQHFRHVIGKAWLSVFSCDVVLGIVAVVILQCLVVVILRRDYILLNICI